MNAERPCTVLVVDDDPAILRLLTSLLTSNGYDVCVASSGSEALTLIGKEPPSIIITDWQMPEMDGLELVRRIRELELAHYIYILFLTGRSDDGALVAAIDAGADDFLKKPVDKSELLARIRAGQRVLALESRLHELADHDGLTGLLLRRPFATCTGQEWNRSLRYRLPLSVVMVDIDHFKQVNDIHGHPLGDEVIRQVANTMRECSRTSDIICRYGGEEFCILLPETDEGGGVVWAERLRERVAKLRIPVGDGDLRLTISLGVAEMLADMEDKDELLGLADCCLLAAKEQGRDRVVALRALSENGGLTPTATDCGLNGILARDAMIPLVHWLRPECPLLKRQPTSSSIVFRLPQ